MLSRKHRYYEHFLANGRLFLHTIKIATLQTVAGCGANRIGAAFLKHHFPGSFAYEEKSGNTAKVYIGTPGWSNHVPLFRHAGFEVETYRHYDPVSCGVDFEALLASLRTAADQSIFVLQASCHNPTGADLTRDQWMTVAAEMRARRHFPFFDISYGGFGTAVPDGGYSDVWAIRHFVDQGFDLVVAQTFSKCMGLYGERVGCLHFACASEDIANRVLDQARCLVRWEYSSPPAFPGRLVGCILSDEGLEASWKEELAMATRRIGRARRELYEWLTVRLSTPGNWECILMGTGMFSFLPLSAQHVEHLAQKSHVWMPRNGRMNMAGLTPKNIELVARAIDAAVRELATL